MPEPEGGARHFREDRQKPGPGRKRKDQIAERDLCDRQGSAPHEQCRAELASEHVSEFAGIATKLQMNTLQLLMAAGKDMRQGATAVVQKAADAVTNTAA